MSPRALTIPVLVLLICLLMAVAMLAISTLESHLVVERPAGLTRDMPAPAGADSCAEVRATERVVVTC
jgi:hypothetical protein